MFKIMVRKDLQEKYGWKVYISRYGVVFRKNATEHDDLDSRELYPQLIDFNITPVVYMTKEDRKLMEIDKEKILRG